MMEKRVPSKFKPLYMHQKNDKLFYVYHGGRGGGKSWEIADFLLIEGAKQKHRILCCREVQKSIKQSVHKLLSDRIAALGLGAFYEILETEIRGKNGTEFSFAGLLSHTVESVKSFEGATITWIEEAQTVSSFSLSILIPTVVRTSKPMVVMSMNPKLPSDAVYSEYVMTERDDTIVVQINYTDNKECPPELVALAEQMKREDYERYEHIWLGKPKEIADGAIYKSEFEQIKRENRICKVPHDPNLPIYTSWDLGILDSTAIWFFQIYGKEVRVIDYYEANNEPLAHYARILDEKTQSYPDNSLADLYDPLLTPIDLLKAHQTLDKAVDAAYSRKKFNSEAERVAFLFELYEQYIEAEKADQKKEVKTKKLKATKETVES